MRLEKLDDAVALRNYRATLLRIRGQVSSMTIPDIKVENRLGEDTSIWNHISAQCVRTAIDEECERLVDEYEGKLRALGVRLEE